MKILGVIPSYRPGYIVEVDHLEMEDLVGDEIDLKRVVIGSTVLIHDLWVRYNALRHEIKAAGTEVPRNLRALADLLEAQVATVPQPSENADV